MKKLLSFFLLFSFLVGLCLPSAAAVEEISINAKAALLVDMETGQILLDQNAGETAFPASITKVMTALLTIEAIGRGDLNMNTVVTVPAEALTDITEDSSTANLVAGEEITVENLLYCLLMASANEAANILAITVSGNIPDFVAHMNRRAAELDMTGTHFVNPHGLHNDDHYSTAWDIYLMAKEAMTHTSFRTIVSTKEYTVPATNKSKERTLYNTNGLLTGYKYAGYSYKGTIGIKTGSTGQAGYCLVSAVKKNGHTLAAVVLGADNPPSTQKKDGVLRNQFIESARLYDWGFDNFTFATLLSNSYKEEIPVRSSFQANHVMASPAHAIEAMIPGELDPEQLSLTVTWKEDVVTAPVAAGQSLGTVSVTYAGQDYGQVDMLAVSDVACSPLLAFISQINLVIGNYYVRILLVLSMLLILIGILRRIRRERQEEWKAKRSRKQEARRARQAQEAIERQEQAVEAERLRRQRQRQHREDQERRSAERKVRQEQIIREKEARQKQREEEQTRRRQERQEREESRARQREEDLQRQRAEDRRRRQAEAQRRLAEREARRQYGEESRFWSDDPIHLDDYRNKSRRPPNKRGDWDYRDY